MRFLSLMRSLIRSQKKKSILGRVARRGEVMKMKIVRNKMGSTKIHLKTIEKADRPLVPINPDLKTKKTFSTQKRQTQPTKTTAPPTKKKLWPPRSKGISENERRTNLLKISGTSLPEMISTGQSAIAMGTSKKERLTLLDRAIGKSQGEVQNR